MPLPISEELLRAYNATVFVVLTEPEVPLHIGVHSPEADLLLARHGATSACIITAWNPFSVSLSKRKNSARQVALVRAVDESGLARLNAEGRDPEGKWPSEESLCVFDVPASLVEDWLRKFGQNAVVIVREGNPPTLAFHPDVEHCCFRWGENGPCRVVQVAVTKWPGGTMAMKFGCALRSALGVAKDEMRLIQSAPERILEAATGVTEIAFRQALTRSNVSWHGEIHFLEKRCAGRRQLQKPEDLFVGA